MSIRLLTSIKEVQKMSKKLQITLSDDGYEQLLTIMNVYFNGSANKSTTIEVAISQLKRYLDINYNKK